MATNAGMVKCRDDAMREWKAMHSHFQAWFQFSKEYKARRALREQGAVLNEWKILHQDLRAVISTARAWQLNQAKRMWKIFFWMANVMVTSRRILKLAERRVALNRLFNTSKASMEHWKYLVRRSKFEASIKVQINKDRLSWGYGVMRWRLSLSNLRQTVQENSTRRFAQRIFSTFANMVRQAAIVYDFMRRIDNKITLRHLDAWKEGRENSRAEDLGMAMVNHIRIMGSFEKWVQFALAWGRGIHLFAERRDLLSVSDAFAEWQFVTLVTSNIDEKEKWLTERRKEDMHAKVVHQWKSILDNKW